MSNNKNKVTKVWVNVEDLENNLESAASQSQEFVEQSMAEANKTEVPNGTTRRDFLKYVGFGLGAATVAGCEIPVKKALPYVIKPEEIVPGVATYYASTFVKGGDCVPVMVKTREGRPIKLDGNVADYLKTWTGGGSTARSQASVLDLYDTNRIKHPGKIVRSKNKAGEEILTVRTMDWNQMDEEIKAKLASASTIHILSHTNLSPTLAKAIEDFSIQYDGRVKHTQYDPFSCSGLLEANDGVIPDYEFDKADVIVGIDADFLGTWINPTAYSAAYISRRNVKTLAGGEEVEKTENFSGADKRMSFHVQFESHMSLTGSNADHRVLIKPSEQGAAVTYLYQLISSTTAVAPSFAWPKAAAAIEKTAARLKAAKGSALVVCGINNKYIQAIVRQININLRAPIGKRHNLQRKGNDIALKEMVDGLSERDAILIMDANPAHDMPVWAAPFSEKVKKCALSLSLNGILDETTALCQYVAPNHNYLESWGDANPRVGYYLLIQPTIRPLFNTRAAGLSLLTWADAVPEGQQPYYEYLKTYWSNNLYPLRDKRKISTRNAFWQMSLKQGGFVATEDTTLETPANSSPSTVGASSTPATTSNIDVDTALSVINETVAPSGMEIKLYETINMGSGQYANNPWLQELPDPVMRTTWDNFVSVHIEWDGEINYTSLNDLKDGDYANLTISGDSVIKMPVIRQFGQLKNTLAAGLGYGRTRAGKAGNLVGQNLFPYVRYDEMLQNLVYSTTATLSKKVGRDSIFACVQMHHTYGLKNDYDNKTINVDEQLLGHKGFQGSLTNRSVFFESSAKDLEANIKGLAKKRKGYQYLNSKGLYPEYKEIYGQGHHWAMAIDLTACTGCGACAVACIAENNVPVVGKYEVAIAHEMTWLRIDRYFYGTEETPNAVYMPMMCQHCDNAPCENVCPVAATNHSSEGLNQMAYNRCIGTRYCANNCPYKVRRFNWLDYTAADVFPANEVNMNRSRENTEYYTYMTDNLTRMVLNPDVTVRSRGVIEKCSFCVQRIQEGKLAAKVEGRKLNDADIQPACVTSCPTGGIVFGDRNDKNSRVAKLMASKVTYIPLEEVNVRSSVHYLMKVTNKDEQFTA